MNVWHLVLCVVILALAYFNPPQIFVIMYFGGTVIASSWSLAAFGSVWSKKLSKTGAFWGMLLGFLGCVVSKILYSALDITPAVILDPFFIGIALSLIGAVLGSVLRPASAGEQALRAALFQAPASTLDEAECRKDHRLWIVYLLFGIALGAFFLFMYALPYCRAVG